jgi:chemotaxis protein histidine kinase CheA
MTATTATAPRYFAARAAGRYRVVDSFGFVGQDDGSYVAATVATCASKAKAEEKAAKLSEEFAARQAEATPFTAEENAALAAAEADELAAAQAAVDAEEAAREAAYEAAQQEESPADARQERAAELADAVAAGAVSFDAAAAELLGGAPVETPAAKPVEKMAAAVAAKNATKDDTVAYRIGKVLREWVLANDADSDLAAHITTRNVCYDGTATLRLTAKWAQELGWLATDLENAAIRGDARVAAKAPAVMAARAARKGLDRLF